MSFVLITMAVATAVSATCSLLEAVFLSITPAYIAVGLKQNRRYAVLLQKMKEDINQPLSAILTLNTIANTVGGSVVGAQVHRIYGDARLALFSGLMTVLILVFGEFVPKVVGASNWKSLAPMAAYAIRFMMFLVYPFVFLSKRLGDRISSEQDSSVSREEVIVTAEMGADEGSIRPKESAIIKNLLMLDNMKVADIMTPRAVIYAFETGSKVGEIMEKHKPIRFSRIPVFKEDLDHILGVVHRYKILEAVSHDQDNVIVDELMTPLHTIPENISVAAALDQFIKRHEHIFIVLDDYGSVTGIVSLEDAIETLLGVEIVDEFDSVADMRQFALDQWRDRKNKLTAVKT